MQKPHGKCLLIIGVAWSSLFTFPILAQDNYEIQVYGSETVKESATMIELHSNYTIDGSTDTAGSVLPTQSAFHETIEITHGFSPVFETGFYFFTSARSGNGWQWIGSHIRPRVRFPEEWQWPVGVSISAEIGYQRPEYATNDWTAELRPIIDKQIGRWYLSLNPSLEYAIAGTEQSHEVEFSPNVKISYDVTPAISAGFEYYGSLGPIGGFDPIRNEQHQIFPSIDLNLSSEWEFNTGIGFGLTSATDRLIAKLILGRRF